MRGWRGAALFGVLGAFATWLVLSGGVAPQMSASSRVPAVGRAAGLAVSPVRSVVDGSKASSEITYTLGNSSAAPRTYTISTGELDAVGRPIADDADNAGRWVRADRSVTVPPHGSATTRLTVRPARDRGASERRVAVTFTDTTPDRQGTVAVRSRITTSVYVEGQGAVVRRARLSDLRLPMTTSGRFDLSARLSNRGTVNLVPGSETDTVVGTNSQGDGFTLGGPVVAPGSSARVVGRSGDLPLACWCQIRVSAPDGSGGTTSVTGRVLVLPWPAIAGIGLLAIVIGPIVALRRRRAQDDRRRRFRIATASVRDDELTPV